MLGTDIAIDLGTSTIKIYLDGKGIILNEPSVIAFDVQTDEVVAIGKEAYAMVGRTSDKISVVHPLCNGVISDFGLAQYVINYYIKKINSSKVFMPRVVVSVPCQITEVEKRAVVDAISAAGVRKICLVEEPVAAALGAKVDISTPHGCLVVDIGGGTTDMAVISLCGVAISRSIQIAGNAFDEAIIKYTRRKYNLVIGKHMAEQAKNEIGCVYPRKEVLKFRIKGRNALSGLPQWTDLSSDEMLEALIEPAMQIIRTMQDMLEKTPPELMGDVYSDGIVLTGGSAQLFGFDTLISKKTKMPVHLAEEPENCVANGAGAAIKFIDDMENKAYGVMNPLSAAY
ncbi:MAG TPA: rod shape-determining protein [Oscillospiraceae bacterium]|nr:rod shape-determining protein [Oscillospiraceae bacterium]